jgi:hypothetical protein
MNFLRLVIIAAILCLAAMPCAADEPIWHALQGDLAKSEKAGFGGLCGLCVDRDNGAILLNVSDRGFYRSTDGGKTLRRISQEQPKGRTEEPGCFLIDPTGKRKMIATALVYGAPISTSADGGATWKSMDARSSHVDWCAIDWSDRDTKFVLAVKHESGGMLIVSRDGGKSFKDIGKGYGTGWVFNNTTAVVAEAKTPGRPKPSLMRTTDGGKTWIPCGDFSPVGTSSAQALPKWHDGVLYWLVDGALIATSDMGLAWKKICDLKDGRYGPIIGRDARHLFVLTTAGIIESADGGTTWNKPIPPPKELNGVAGLTWLDYDPNNDALLIMKMNSPLFVFTRKK